MKTQTTTLTLSLIAGLTLAGPALSNDRDDRLRLVVPPWPGVTVKSEIFSQLIEPLGYTPETLEISSTVGYSTLQSGDSDAFLAGWMPAQQESYDAAMEADAIVDLGNNVNGARMGFAVPDYVYEAGITRAEQLAAPAIAERFERTVYSIESGSTITDMIDGAIDSNTHGLEGWELMASSTPGMLSEVNGAVEQQRWILFYGWTPHWMVPEYDVHILDDSADIFGADGGRSDVKTIVARDYAEANPNLARLLDQFELSAEEQSKFILEYSLKERDLEDVAHDWLVDNPERVASFLEGVTTRDGEDALSAVEAGL